MTGILLNQLPWRRLCFRRRRLVRKLVCMSAGLRKTTRPTFTKFGGKLTHGRPRKKPSDFGVNPAVDPDQGIVNGIFYNFGPRP